MGFMKYLRTLNSWFAFAGALVGSISLLIMMSLITIDVLSRNLFNSPILGIDHITAYLLVVIVFMGLGYAFEKGSHIKVDVITLRLSQMVNRRLEFGVYVVGIIGTAVILWHSWWMVFSAYKMGTNLISGAFEIPAYIPQLFVPLGFSLLFLQLVAEFIGKIGDRLK